MNTHKKILALTISSLLLGLSVSDPAWARRSSDDSRSSTAQSWTYLGAYNSSTGKPNTLATGCTVPSGIMNKVLTLLPEGHHLAATSPLLTENNQANILLNKQANIKVAFIDEGAGYTNSLGFFSFDKTALSSLTTASIVEKIMFPNYSKTNAGGALTLGDTVDLGTFAAGQGIGFTLVSNGWSSGVTKSDRTKNQIFRTVKEMNPESSTQKLNYHTVLLSDPDSKVLVIGIEDLNRENSSYNDYSYGTDDDFNDAVLAICVDPFDAIDSVGSLININTGTVTTTTTAPTTVKGVSGRQSWSERTEPRMETDDTTVPLCIAPQVLQNGVCVTP